MRAKLRQIPPVDRVLERVIDHFNGVPRPLLVRLVRGELDRLRRVVLEEVEGTANGVDVDEALATDQLVQRVSADLDAWLRPRHRRVVNATGVLLHTGLGRAPLGDLAIDAVQRIGRAGLVEIDPVTGERGRRELFVRDLLCDLTGAEEATVVNNNAAALVLLLRGLAQGREVVVSRGELVEIGGGFRVPDVMSESGAHLVEVGTTNRTRAVDYEAACGDDTSMLLQIHSSNFKIVGFSEAPTTEELVAIGKRRGVLVCSDLGSGYLRRLSELPFTEEPVIEEAVQAGMDVVTFSGDKMLGGPQCGVLVGKKKAILTLRRHPMFRALRPDKLTLAALEATLLAWRAAEGGVPHGVPFYRAMATPMADLTRRAKRIVRRVGARMPALEVAETMGQVGSGSVPGLEFPSVAVRLLAEGGVGQRIATALRTHETPVFTRVQDGAIWLDLRTIAPDEDDDVIGALRAVVPEAS